MIDMQSNVRKTEKIELMTKRNYIDEIFIDQYKKFGYQTNVDCSDKSVLIRK